MSKLNIRLTGVAIIAILAIALLLAFSPRVRAMLSQDANHCVMYLEPVAADSTAASKSTELGCYETFEEASSVATDYEAPTETDPLLGTRWKLLAFADQLLPEEPKMVVEFKNGGLSLEGGCNSVAGSYELVEAQLTIGLSKMTEMDCEELGINEIESTFFTALKTFESYTISDDELRIRYVDGELLLRRLVD